MTKLWRQILGETIRAERRERGQRLVDVAGTAGISPQYLSEIERGRKEPSSEMVEAVAGALHLTTVDLVRRAADAEQASHATRVSVLTLRALPAPAPPRAARRLHGPVLSLAA